MLRVLFLALLACSRSKPAPAAHSGETTATVVTDATLAPDAVVHDAASEQPSVDVPTEPARLQAWLVAGHYKAWAHESKAHPSEGPHGDAVKTFLSPSLAASLAKGGDHPRGVVAVKELYTGKKLAHTGWAVSVKLEPQSDSGRKWYWYEVFSTKPGAKPAYAGIGEELCRECHEGGGTDQVLIGFPLL